MERFTYNGEIKSCSTIKRFINESDFGLHLLSTAKGVSPVLNKQCSSLFNTENQSAVCIFNNLASQKKNLNSITFIQHNYIKNILAILLVEKYIL